MATTGTDDRLTALREFERTWGDLHSLGLSCAQAGTVTPDEEERYNKLVGRAQYFYDKVHGDLRAPYVEDYSGRTDAFAIVLREMSLAEMVGAYWVDNWKAALSAAAVAIRHAIGRLEAEAEGAREPAPKPGRAAVAPAAPEPRNDTLVANETSTEYFVAHEFTPEKTDDMRRAIDEALAGSGLTPYYADKEVKEGHIFTNKILRKIRATRFGIYDLSNPRKANVFMELGAAIAMRKPYFIICEQGTELPSDVLGLDRIEYESYVDLTRQLKAKVAKAPRGAP